MMTMSSRSLLYEHNTTDGHTIYLPCWTSSPARSNIYGKPGAAQQTKNKYTASETIQQIKIFI